MSSVKSSLFSRFAVGYYINNNSCPLGEGRTVNVRGRPCGKELWKWYICLAVIRVPCVFHMTDTIKSDYTFRIEYSDRCLVHE
jgi:hypothetical protein